MPPVAVIAVAAFGAISAGAAIAGAIGVTAFLGLSVATWTAIGAVGMLVSGLALAATMPKPKVPESAGQQLNMKLTGNEALPIGYGRTATGGSIYYRGTSGRSNKTLAMLVALSIGGTSAVTEVRANDYKLSLSGGFNGGKQTTIAAIGDSTSSSKMFKKNSLHFWHLPGLNPQPATFAQVSGLPIAPDKSSGVATAIIQADYDQEAFPQGLPKFTWVGNWNKVYDPRKDSTYPGGSGSHRLGNEATYEWTENPHLAALDWTLGRFENGKKRYGIGAPPEEVDIPAFVAGANVCDALGWTVGGIVQTTDDKFAVLGTLLQAGGAIPLNRGSQISCLTYTVKASIYNIGKDDVVGSASVVNTAPNRDRKNRVTPTYRAESQFWNLIAGEAVSAAQYVAEDSGEIRSTEVQLPFVQKASQAHQLATYDLVNTREFLTFEITAKPKLLAVRVGDCVTVTLPDIAVNNQKCMVVQRDFDPNTFQIKLTLRSETDAKHAFALGQSQVAPPSPSLSTFDPSAPDGPTSGSWSITDGTITNDDGMEFPALVISGANDDPTTKSIIFEFRKVGTTNWSSPREVPATATQMAITDVVSAFSYEVAVSYRTVLNVVSPRLIIGSVTTGDAIVNAILNQGDLATSDVANWASQVTGVGKPENDATKSRIFRSATAPTGASVNDVWVKTSGSTAVAIYAWNGSAWILGSDITASNIAAGIENQGQFATQNAADWASQITGVGKPENDATKSRILRSATAPSNPNVNDIWVKLSGSTPIAVMAWSGSAWITGADLTSLNIAAGIVGQGPGATDPRDPNETVSANQFGEVVRLGGFGGTNSTFYSLSGCSGSTPPGGNSGQLRLTRTTSSAYIRLTPANFSGENRGEYLNVVKAKVRAVENVTVGSQWRGLVQVYGSFSDGATVKSKTVSWPIQKDGSDRLSTTKYLWATWDFSDDATFDGAVISELRFYLIPASAGGGQIDIDWLSAGTFNPNVLGMNNVSRNADQTSGNTAASIVGQGPAATGSDADYKTSLGYSAGNNGEPLNGNYGIVPAPSFYRARGMNTYVERKTEAGVLGTGSGALYGILTTYVPDSRDDRWIQQKFFFNETTWTRRSFTSDANWSQWNQTYDESRKPYFGADLLETNGGPVATVGAFKTSEGTASGFSGQGYWATQNYVDLASGRVTGKDLANIDPGQNSKLVGIAANATRNTGNLADVDFVYFGNSGIRESSGGSTATLNNFKTALGDSAGFAGQGALATKNTITGSLIDTGSVGLESLASIPTGENRYPDYDMASPKLYDPLPSSVNFAFGNSINEMGPGRRELIIEPPSVASDQVIYGPLISNVEAGEVFWAGCWAEVRGSGSAAAQAYVRFRNKAGSILATIKFCQATSTAPKVYGATMIAPVGTSEAQFLFMCADGTGRAAAFNSPMFIKRMRDSRLASNGLSSQALMSVSPSNPLTASNSSGARILVSAFTITGDWGESNYSSATITGLSYDRLYYVWVRDAAFAGGSVTYVATTSASTYVSNPDYIFLGPCRTRTSSGGGGVIQPDDPTCVQVDMVGFDGRRMAEVEAGDPLLLLKDDGSGSYVGEVQGNRIASAPCVKITTASGAWIVVSETTPLTGQYGEVIDAVDAPVGRLIAVQDDDGFRWEPITEVVSVGEKLVAKVSAWSGTYAAGGERNRMVFTHNVYFKP